MSANNSANDWERHFVVVVGVDLKESGGHALEQAIHIARRIRDSELHVIHVDTGEAPPSEAAELSEQLRFYVHEKALALGGFTGQTVCVHLRIGDPSREILQLAGAVGADLILLGTNDTPHQKSLVVGSVAARVMEAATCTVVIAGPKAPRHVSHREEDVASLPPTLR